MIELDVQSSGQGRESLQSPLVLLYSLVAIVSMLLQTLISYSQYHINTCNGTVRLASTMLVASV